MNKTKRNILFAITGMSPAVLTETIWALATSKNAPIIIDDIFVFTTLIGKSVLENTLLSKIGKTKKTHWDLFKEHLSAKINSDLSQKMLLTSYIVSQGLILDERKNALEDIKNESDNLAVADFFMEKIFPKTSDDDNRVFASIAGGRKSMGAMLHSVMGLLARCDDKILHILVSPPWDRIGGFLYPTCPGDFYDPTTKKRLDSKNAQLTLLEIPFVSMGKILDSVGERKRTSYKNLVAAINNITSNKQDVKLVVNIKNKSVSVGDTMLENLPAGQIAFIYAIAKMKLDGIENGSYFDAVFEEYFTMVASANGLQYNRDNIRAYRAQLKNRMVFAKIGKLCIDKVLPYGRTTNISISANCIKIVE